ncbi:ATP-binding cassette domain-containing protein [bacterium]|nr:ATP-binding cassette domain-containing protein [bacterium]
MQPHLRAIKDNRLILSNMGASVGSAREMLDPLDKPFPVQGDRLFRGLKDSISFEAVGFTHDARREPSIFDLSFTMHAGQTTMVSGPSGSGKTTILNLLLRLYEPKTGHIFVDGEELAKFTRHSWMSQLAIAGQDIELIENTIAQNLRLGRQDASDEDLREACRMVEILEDIEKLPDGFETSIGAATGLVYTGYRLIDKANVILPNFRPLCDMSGQTICQQIATNFFSNASSIMVPLPLARSLGGHDPRLRQWGIEGAEDLLFQL